MTRDEVLKVLVIIKTTYPHSFKDMTKEEAEAVRNLWTEMFQDEPAEKVIAAVKAYIANDTKGFAPSIGQVKDFISKLFRPDAGLTEMEAWNIVQKAIRDSYYHATDHFNRFPDVIKKIVGSPSQLKEWGQMDAEVVNSVIQSNFMRSYTAKAAQEKELMLLPSSTRATLEGLSQKFMMIE